LAAGDDARSHARSDPSRKASARVYDEVLDQRVWIGCFPFRFKGGEAAYARIVAVDRDE
jgi:hypothetical protein